MTTLNILKIIIENIKNKENVLNQNIDLKIISNFFKKVKTDKNKFNYAYLNYYLYNNISNEIVAKRKTTSRDFEDIIATIFDGSITDENKRENINIENFIVLHFDFANYGSLLLFESQRLPFCRFVYFSVVINQLPIYNGFDHFSVKCLSFKWGPSTFI